MITNQEYMDKKIADLSVTNQSGVNLEPEWHDLTRYEIISPIPAKSFKTRNGYRAGIHINPSNTVYSYKTYGSVEEADTKAAEKIQELLQTTKGK